MILSFGISKGSLFATYFQDKYCIHKTIHNILTYDLALKVRTSILHYRLLVVYSAPWGRGAKTSSKNQYIARSLEGCKEIQITFHRRRKEMQEIKDHLLSCLCFCFFLLQPTASPREEKKFIESE